LSENISNCLLGREGSMKIIHIKPKAITQTS